MDIVDVSRPKDGCLEVDVMVSPRSNRSGPEGYDEWRKRLIVRVRAPPLEGRANQEIEEMFRDITGSRCAVTAGHTNRMKTVTVYGDPVAAADSIREAADGSHREVGEIRCRDR